VFASVTAGGATSWEGDGPRAASADKYSGAYEILVSSGFLTLLLHTKKFLCLTERYHMRDYPAAALHSLKTQGLPTISLLAKSTCDYSTSSTVTLR
jgi:hypothetical protein